MNNTHLSEAEKLLRIVADRQRNPTAVINPEPTSDLLAEAQVHATIGLADAIVDAMRLLGGELR